MSGIGDGVWLKAPAWLLCGGKTPQGEEEKDVALGQVHGASAGIFDRRGKRSAGYRQH